MNTRRWHLIVVLLVVAGCTAHAGVEETAESEHGVVEDDADEADDADKADDADEGDGADAQTEQAQEAVDTDDPAELPPHKQPPPPDRRYDISEVYAEACVACHGERGGGDGTEEEGFSFDTPADEWTNGPTVDGILKTLDDGIHDTPMQQFEQFTNEDRIELAEYVIDLRHALKGDEDDER